MKFIDIDRSKNGRITLNINCITKIVERKDGGAVIELNNGEQYTTASKYAHILDAINGVIIS